MIKIENTEVWGFKGAIRGMRNAKNSWDRMDSYIDDDGMYILGDNDKRLAQTLANLGPVHGKFLRDIHIQTDITAPIFWWSEMDTYKVATVKNSCSKMHTIHVKPFEYEDFSHEGCDKIPYAKQGLLNTISICENLRVDYNKTKNKDYWRALIESLPEGFNMKATMDFNYETMADIYQYRRCHKLFEWADDFITWIEGLPYSHLITTRCSLNKQENK